MPTTRLLVDMSMSPKTVEGLRNQGWDIIRVSQVLPQNTTDRHILDFARRETRVVITHDLDFSSLLALGGYSSPSPIALRLSLADPDRVTRLLLGLLPGLESDLADGCPVTVDDATVRVRKLPIR